MRKKATADRDSAFFWSSATEFLNNELPGIRKKSPNTVESYRQSLNRYIDFLESEKSVKRKDMCYWYSVLGNAAAMASFIPVRPSAQMMRMSSTPRFFSSFKTDSQYLELSFSPTSIVRTSLRPS